MSTAIQWKDMTHTAAQIDSAVDAANAHIADSGIHMTAAEKTKLAGLENYDDTGIQQALAEETAAREAADTALQTAVADKITAADAFGVGTLIEDDTIPRDLNSSDFKVPGRYSFSSAVAKTMANCPFSRYKLLTSEPSDWAAKYKTDYYTRSVATSSGGAITYSHITGDSAPAFAADTYYEVAAASGGTVVVECVHTTNRIRQTGYANSTVSRADAAFVRFYSSSYNAWSNWFADALYGIGWQIVAGEDLNDLTQPGTYYCDATATARTLLNIPFVSDYSAFKLKVEYIQSENNLRQTLIPLYSNTSFFIRQRMTGASGTWRSWYYYGGTEVTTTVQTQNLSQGLQMNLNREDIQTPEPGGIKTGEEPENA